MKLSLPFSGWSTRDVLLSLFSLDIAVAGLGIARSITLHRPLNLYFTEGTFITWFSALKLLLCAGLAGRIFWVRRSPPVSQQSLQPPPERRLYRVWLLCSIGFLFLFLDEKLQLHEHSEGVIVKAFSLNSTTWLLHINDLIIGLYAAIGGLLLYQYRREFKHYREVFIGMKLILLPFFFMLLIDSLNTTDIWIRSFLFEPKVVQTVHEIVYVTEEVLKLLLETVLVAVFYRCLGTARRLEQ